MTLIPSLAQPLGVSENALSGCGEEVAHLVMLYAGEPDEHDGVLYVVVRDVVSSRIVGEECRPLCKSVRTTSDAGSADRWIARHATSRLPSLSAGEPYIVLSCTSGNSRPIARTASKFTAVFRIRDEPPVNLNSKY
jgi:hypothetical protein